MKILVTGAAGLLGTDVVRIALERGHEVAGFTRADLDVTDTEATTRAFADTLPDAVIHCAAYTRVDDAEAEPGVAMAVNRDGTRNVAAAAQAGGARMCLVSTDYVFDGHRRRPYRPDDAPAPLSAYGLSKLAAEEVATAVSAESLIVRTGWLFGHARPSFVTSMLARATRGERLRIVEDQVGRPTWSAHAAEALVELLELRAAGIWHVANGGTASRAELIREALRLRDLPTEVEGVSTEVFGAAADRPRYSVMAIDATEERLDRRMWPWRDALSRFLTELDERSGGGG